jgi:hypothetical protein
MWNQFKSHFNEDVQHTEWPTTMGMVAALLFTIVGATQLLAS